MACGSGGGGIRVPLVAGDPHRPRRLPQPRLTPLQPAPHGGGCRGAARGVDPVTASCPSSYVTAALDEESRSAALQESRPAVARRRLRHPFPPRGARPPGARTSFPSPQQQRATRTSLLSPRRPACSTLVRRPHLVSLSRGMDGGRQGGSARPGRRQPGQRTVARRRPCALGRRRGGDRTGCGRRRGGGRTGWRRRRGKAARAARGWRRRRRGMAGGGIGRTAAARRAGVLIGPARHGKWAFVPCPGPDFQHVGRPGTARIIKRANRAGPKSAPGRAVPGRPIGQL